MNRPLFVTGTDTSVGKTLISASLLQAACNAGLSCYGLKPIAAGCQTTEEGLRNEDALLLQRHSSVRMSYEQVNPIALAAAVAPHIAAAQAHRSLQLSRIEGFCRGSLMQKADLRLVEGAGGWHVPLNAQERLSDLPVRMEMPVILVVGVKLGCINHSLLTLEAIQRSGAVIAGWVANCIDPAVESLEANINTLRHYLPAPLFGVVPWQAQPGPVEVAKFLDLSLVLTASQQAHSY